MGRDEQARRIGSHHELGDDDVSPEPEARQYYLNNQALFESAGRPLPFEEVRERVQQQVVTFKRQEALNALLVRLRTAARIEKFI